MVGNDPRKNKCPRLIPGTRFDHTKVCRVVKLGESQKMADLDGFYVARESLSIKRPNSAGFVTEGAKVCLPKRCGMTIER